MDTNILLFKTQSKISSICTYQVPEADSYKPFIVCTMWGYFSKPWTCKEPVWKMQQTSGKKTTELCSVKHATIGYTLSARASLRQSIQSYVVTTIHGYAMTAQIFNSRIHFFENDVSTASEINDSIDLDICEQLSSARRKHPKRFVCAYLNINSLRHKIDYTKDLLVYYLLQKPNWTILSLTHNSWLTTITYGELTVLKMEVVWKLT